MVKKPVINMVYFRSIRFYYHCYAICIEHFSAHAKWIYCGLLILYTNILGGWYLARCLGANHFLFGIRMRAMISAILLFVLNFIGVGFDPMLTGFVRDFLTPEFGDDGLRYGLSLTMLISIWCAFHYYRCLKAIKQEISRAPT